MLLPSKESRNFLRQVPPKPAATTERCTRVTPHRNVNDNTSKTKPLLITQVADRYHGITVSYYQLSTGPAAPMQWPTTSVSVSRRCVVLCSICKWWATWFGLSVLLISWEMIPYEMSWTSLNKDVGWFAVAFRVIFQVARARGFGDEKIQRSEVLACFLTKLISEKSKRQIVIKQNQKISSMQRGKCWNLPRSFFWNSLNDTVRRDPSRCGNQWHIGPTRDSSSRPLHLASSLDTSSQCS